MGVCRQEQISESVDNVFCLKSDVVDSASAAISRQEQEEASAPCTTELLEESGSVDAQPLDLVSEQDAPREDSEKVDSSTGLASECTQQQEAVTQEEITHGSTEMVLTADEGEADGHAVSQNILHDSLSGAKRLPKAAANILRMPYDSIRRRDGESGSASSDDGGEVAVESPAAAGPGLMSRTLGSITALPSLFAKSSTDSAAATPPPSSPRSTPDKPDRDRSPGSTRSRTYFFHRLVGRSGTNSSEADTSDASRTVDDGNLTILNCSVSASEL